MTVSLTARAKAERIVKENIAAIDTAISFLRAHDMAETADKLAFVRDYLARSESYYRRIEANEALGEERRSARRAERMWLDVTGQRRK